MFNRQAAAKLFVHEFAHLRYGVFDEYIDARTPLCGSHDQTNRPRASLMADIHSSSVEEFCDNTADPSRRHDPRPRTRQNVECSNRSVWEVIRQTDDFVNFERPSPLKRVKPDQHLKPKFKVTKLSFSDSKKETSCHCPRVTCVSFFRHH